MCLFWVQNVTGSNPVLPIPLFLSTLCQFMETPLQFTQEFYPQTHLHFHFHFMHRLSPKFKPTISLTSTISVRAFSASLTQTETLTQTQPKIIVPERRRRVKASDAELKENWLTSLSYPLNEEQQQQQHDSASKWVLGIDPDVSGAVALLKTSHHESASIPLVFDSPYVQILVGKRSRKRLDTKSIVQLVRSFDAPVGTTAYIEQSLPYPQDGKQGWWSGGFGYGLWIGILVSSGFSVVPVPSFTWKAKFELSGINGTKDDSRRVASTLFPSLSSLLSRKKDHGRAEALLIAAYGKGQNIDLESSSCEKLGT